MTKQKHIHHDCIVAWAKGETIEALNKTTLRWCEIQEPKWYKEVEYRIKPKPPVIRYRWVIEGADRKLFISKNYYSEEEVKEANDVVQRIDSTRREDKE